MKLFFRSLISGIAGGSLGGLMGMALGLGSSVFNLSSTNFRDGLIMGAFLGVLPALIIGTVHAARYRKVPRRSTRLLAPFHAAVLTFLPVCILMTIWVAAIAAC